jgi:hypothetical protein
MKLVKLLIIILIHRKQYLGVPVEFLYQLNQKKDSILFVPNLGNTKFQGRNKPIRVKIDQTATHIHHASDFGIV